jgi:hypothetical protein
MCEAEWGRIATAASRFGDYLSLHEQLPTAQKVRQGERLKVARARREALLREVPELTLMLPPGAPAGTVVTRDGAVISDAALGLALPLDPGEHVLTTIKSMGAIIKSMGAIGAAGAAEAVGAAGAAGAAEAVEAARAASRPARAGVKAG